jgi:uncharacterized FlaG/YvyC family protein
MRTPAPAAVQPQPLPVFGSGPESAQQAKPALETIRQASADQLAQKHAEVKAKEQISTDELAAMLHKLNLTFDLFEISAEFSFDQEDNQVRVVVRNTRTNEVIRRIPAHEFKAQFTNFRDGVGLLIDSFL